MHVTKEWTFDAAHRLAKGYKGKCAQLHGHTYRVEVMLSADQLDQFDFVVNFDDIKTWFREWTDMWLDHGTMICGDDNDLGDFLKSQGQKLYGFGKDNPTAEVIARHLMGVFRRILDQHDTTGRVQLSVVRIWETPTSSAIVSHGSDITEGA